MRISRAAGLSHRCAGKSHPGRLPISRSMRPVGFFDRLGDNLRRVHNSLLNLHLDESIACFTGTSSGASLRVYKPLFNNVLVPVMLMMMKLHDSYAEKRLDRRRRKPGLSSSTSTSKQPL